VELAQDCCFRFREGEKVDGAVVKRIAREVEDGDVGVGRRE
jgi:hypothetical protein